MANPPNLLRKAVTCVFGAGDAGKTGAVLKYLLNAPATCRFILESDKADYQTRLKLPVATTALALEVGIRRGWGLAEPTLFGVDTADVVGGFCAVAMDFAAALPGRKLFVLDEAWRYCDPRNLPLDLANVIRNGRKVGLQSLFLCQEPRQVNETLLAEATEILCFRLAGLNSLGRLADYGFPDCEKLPDLPRGSFIALNRENGAVLRGKLF